MDGIDAALVCLDDRRCDTIATTSYAYPQDLRQALIAASRKPDETTVDVIGELDHWVGTCFSDATKALLDSAATEPSSVRAIGSHGQTLRHRPHAERPFTLQIGDPNIIANSTGITTVADFRRRDLAAGGEGAPLTPAFHQWLFTDQNTDRVVLNIGGIANITILPADKSDVIGFDTGPGNGLMDAWTQQEQNRPFDDGGAWARSGEIQPELLAHMLTDPYFSLQPPKSTGFEYFNSDWLGTYASGNQYSAADIQATLLAVTAQSITAAIECYAPRSGEILVCGGGIHNISLMDSLQQLLASKKWSSTLDYGLDPDWVEAAAFAWLAKQTLSQQPGNLPTVTGATEPQVLGGIYLCAG
jgi:anhydro-N-acetylmuramic acid kinase